MKEQLYDKIIELHNYYVTFKKLIAQQQAKITQEKDNILKGDNIPSPEELESLYTAYYVDLVSFGTDLQLIYGRLGFYIDLYIELTQGELTEDVKTFYKEYKRNFPKQAFIVKDDKIVEGEEGMLEQKRKEFLASDFFKELSKMLG